LSLIDWNLTRAILKAPPELKAIANRVNETLTQILEAAATGEF